MKEDMKRENVMEKVSRERVSLGREASSSSLT